LVCPSQLIIPHKVHPVPTTTEHLLSIAKNDVGVITFSVSADSSVEDAVGTGRSQLPLKLDSVIAILAITLVIAVNVSCRSSWCVRKVARGKGTGVHDPVQYRNTRNSAVERSHDRTMQGGALVIVP
jgi:hypothetical protein